MQSRRVWGIVPWEKNFFSFFLGGQAMDRTLEVDFCLKHSMHPDIMPTVYLSRDLNHAN